MVKLDKIYTKAGDSGKTRLSTGEPLDKWHPRVTAYGTVDETNAALGVAALHADGEMLIALRRIQNDLFDLGADLATPDRGKKLEWEPLRIVAAQVTRLETEIDAMNEAIAPLDSFILPGGSALAAQLHVARTLCRRAERQIADCRRSKIVCCNDVHVRSVGAEVADHGLPVGRQLIGAHGLNGGQAHDEAPYRIVGRLAPTGTVIDRLILTSLTSVWALHGDDPEHESAAHEHEHEHERDHAGREITALLIRYRSPLAAAVLPREVMQSPGLMAATPAQEWLRLRVLAEPVIRALLGLAMALAALAALAMLAALNSALDARRYDLAVLRALGATRWQVVRLLWLEAALLAVVGTLLGSVLARLAAALISLALPAQPFTAMAWVAGEGWVYLLALGLASLAVWLPAWRAYRTDVAGVLSRP